jgi:ADP-ribose pyrophosphatase YjhB (NUDIX family)
MDAWRVRLEPVITPLFRTWWRFSRAATLGVRGVACNDAGHVLLVKHTYLAGWHLPGGGVERGETAPFAISREMAEEGGIEATDEPTIFALYSNHANFAGDHIALYRFGKWKECAPRFGNEIAERGFFPAESPPPGTTKATLRRLAEVFNGAPVSATW